MSAPTEPAPEVPVTQQREFWVLMAYAVVLGVFGAFAALVFMGVITFGGKWYTDSDPGWFGGQWWWVAVTAAAGVAVGLLRRLTHLPEQTPGLIDDLKDKHVDPRLVPGIVAVSAVSLIGGASLGPEKALGTIGGGAGSWIARRRALDDEDSQVNTLAGFTGHLRWTLLQHLDRGDADPGGGPPWWATVRSRPLSRGRRLERLVRHLFRHRRRVFLDAYKVPPYEFEDWQLLAGIPLGLFAAVLVTRAGRDRETGGSGSSVGCRSRVSCDQHWAAWCSGLSA